MGAGNEAADLLSSKGLDLTNHLGGIVVGQRDAILEAAILCGGRQAIATPFMNSRSLSCANAKTFLSPGGEWQGSASGLKGAKTVGSVMPAGPSCAPTRDVIGPTQANADSNPKATRILTLATPARAILMW